MFEHLNGLQAKIKKQAPQAVFLHCLAHRLNLVLQQSCNSISNCRIFLHISVDCNILVFHCIFGVTDFFSPISPKRTHTVDVIMGRRIPVAVITRWTSNSKIVSLINNEWDSLKQAFAEIINDPSSDQTSVRQNDGYLNKFKDFEIALLVVVCNDIFVVTDILFDVLQKKSFDIHFCILQIKNALTAINNKRNEGTSINIFDKAASRATVSSEQRDGRTRTMLTRDLLVEIPNLFGKFPPPQALNNLKETYPSIFTEFQRLKNELQLIYSDDQYHNMEPHRLMESLFANSSIFKEAYKLLYIIVSIPSTSVSVKRSFSCLKRIKTYLRSTMLEDRLTDLSKISIEKELLNELIASQPFYNDIINKLAIFKGQTYLSHIQRVKFQ
nr:unnamed protein product [Callosobruchus analis]